MASEGTMARIRIAALLIAVVACGDNKRVAQDGGTDGSADVRCGNFMLEPGEQCDDGDVGLDEFCDPTCKLTCGNGTVDSTVGELCDTGVSGSCPATCSDGQACTSDVLDGTACTANCVFSPISAAVDGDGCCPAGANANNDDDCTANCGNGILELGELCDTGITAGAGACPVTCNDTQACTTDVLMNAGSCQATCSNTPITMPIDSDGCCPTGATSATDNDCLASCGNGVVDGGETCDTGIANGTGSCPVMCIDGNACTQNVLSNAGTCTAACSFPAITNPANGDGCCPSGANANNDNDCAPTCGNNVVETGEQCDDGNTMNGDSCSSTCQFLPSAFRFADLDLRDPHVWVDFLGCRDVTDNALLGFSVNGELQTNIQTDGDADGDLDLSPTLVFRPLTQTNAATTPVQLYFGDCSSPLASTMCSPGVEPPISVVATNSTTLTCLTPIAGTTRPYTPAITSSTAPCFSTSSTTVTFDLSGIPVTLQDARIAATYSGSPATQLLNGLLIGFISETDANNTIIPASFPLVGGKALSTLLPGGNPPGPDQNCASFSDKDMNGTTPGWWFYLNFRATRVPWTEP
jgi:cysteine-rich repeat protein